MIRILPKVVEYFKMRQPDPILGSITLTLSKCLLYDEASAAYPYVNNIMM